MPRPTTGLNMAFPLCILFLERKKIYIYIKNKNKKMLQITSLAIFSLHFLFRPVTKYDFVSRIPFSQTCHKVET
jgi:membrane-associated HD superfamily phosphohydrolase